MDSIGTVQPRAAKSDITLHSLACLQHACQGLSRASVLPSSGSLVCHIAITTMQSLPCYSHTGIHFQALHSQQHRSSSTGPTYPTKHSHVQQAYMGQKFTSTVTLIKTYTQNQYRARTSEHKQKHPQSGCTSHADRKHLQQVNTHCLCDQTQNSRTQTRRQFQKKGQIYCVIAQEYCWIRKQLMF